MGGFCDPLSFPGQKNLDQSGIRLSWEETWGDPGGPGGSWWELQIVKRIKEAYDYRGRKHRVGALDQTIPGQRGI